MRSIVISPDDLAILWRQHAASLVLLCSQRSRSPEDCVQEAFIKLATEHPVPREPIAWLVRVARNEAISRWRAEQRRRSREHEVAIARQDWTSLSIVNSYTENPSPIEIQQALSYLDETTREIIVAHIWNGLTFGQIATAFDTSRSKAHRQYVNGLEQLKKLLV